MRLFLFALSLCAISFTGCSEPEDPAAVPDGTAPAVVPAPADGTESVTE